MWSPAGHCRSIRRWSGRDHPAIPSFTVASDNRTRGGRRSAGLRLLPVEHHHDQGAAEELISEIGVDTTIFAAPSIWRPGPRQPRNDQSAGKRRSAKTGKGNTWLRTYPHRSHVLSPQDTTSRSNPERSPPEEDFSTAGAARARSTVRLRWCSGESRDSAEGVPLTVQAAIRNFAPRGWSETGGAYQGARRPLRLSCRKLNITASSGR